MYENSPIKASLIASMMVLVESLKKATNVKMDILAKEIQKANNQLLPYIETVKKYEKQVSALRNNGFSSAEIQKPQNVKFAEEKIAEAQHFLKSLRTLEAIKNLRFFGDNALLVRYDDFEKIMYAYNLRCSTLDKFKGEIPAEKIDGLCAIFDRMESLNTYWRKTINKLDYRWKSHSTLTLLAKQDLPTFGYNMADPLKSWCWGSILFYPFKISRFS